MKILPFALLSSVLLSACQTAPSPKQLPIFNSAEQIQTIWQNLSQPSNELDKRMQTLREFVQTQTVQQTLYFDADWNPVAQKDPQGYYRLSYGLQDNGLYLMQDFYGDGKEQTSPFYGTQPENTDSTSARGHLILYSRTGAVEEVYYVVHDDYYQVVSADSHTGMAWRKRQQGARSEETLISAGKVIATMLYDTNTLARYEAFYPNGQTAYMIEAKGFSSPRTYRLTSQYYLPSGEKSKDKPNHPEFIQLKNLVLKIEKQLLGREEADSVWLDAEQRFPLVREYIENALKEGLY